MWEKGYADSPLLKEERCIEVGNDREIAKTLRQKTGADLTLYSTLWQNNRPAFSPGRTREMDMLTLWYGDRIVMMELSGQEILDDMKTFTKARDAAVAEKKAKKKTTENDEPVRTLCFFPEPKPEDIVPQKLYSVAAYVWEIESYVETTHKNPGNMRRLAVTMQQILK